jgi:hypothetical protein
VFEISNAAPGSVLTRSALRHTVFSATPMSLLKVSWIEHQLAETLIKLRGSSDPDTRKILLTEMRELIAELDRLVLESTKQGPDRGTR